MFTNQSCLQVHQNERSWKLNFFLKWFRKLKFIAAKWILRGTMAKEDFTGSIIRALITYNHSFWYFLVISIEKKNNKITAEQSIWDSPIPQRFVQKRRNQVKVHQNEKTTCRCFLESNSFWKELLIAYENYKLRRGVKL